MLTKKLSKLGVSVYTVTAILVVIVVSLSIFNVITPAKIDTQDVKWSIAYNGWSG